MNNDLGAIEIAASRFGGKIILFPSGRGFVFGMRSRRIGELAIETYLEILGEEGALALINGRFRRIRPHRVQVRDSTGAGDAFHGAFAAGLARGVPVLKALDLASRAGAYACRALGATRSLLRRSVPKTA